MCSFRKGVREGCLSFCPSKLSNGLGWSLSPQSHTRKSHQLIVLFKGAYVFQISVEHILYNVLPFSLNYVVGLHVHRVIVSS